MKEHNTSVAQPVTPNAPAWFNRAQIARHLGVGQRTIDAMQAERKIPFARVRGRVLFNPAEVDAYLKKTATVAPV